MNAQMNVVPLDSRRKGFVPRSPEQIIRDGVEKRLRDAGKSHLSHEAGEYAVSAWKNCNYTVNNAIDAALRFVNCVVIRPESNLRA